jgi:beta-lactamase class D
VLRRACLAVVFGCVTASAQTAPDLGKHFEGLDGTFVLLNGSTGEYIRHNPRRAAQRFAPCSTFKVPHTTILLETGVAPNPNFTLTYDPALKQPENWAQDFNLRQAYRQSALWYYQVLARRLGMARERELVERFQYGNRDTSGGLDLMGTPFWVDGTLRISANEQVDFLKRLNEGRLGLSGRTTSLTRDIMLAEETPSWRLRAKTGACQPAGEETSNWYVGFVEKAGTTYYFALQMGAKDYGRAYSQRIPISRAILAELGILD